MHLQSVTLKGFKSFPDRTRLEFAPGVSVVVGPNGSGKSNITDASTRSVRTSEFVAASPASGGAAARSRSGSPSRSATRRHERPDTACARILVSRPAPCDSAASRGYRCVVTARPSTESPRNASRS